MEALKAMDELRPFVVGLHTTPEWRIEQLELLRQALIDEKEAMLSALQADLHADNDQATLFQLASIFGEIDLCIESLREWAAPRKVATPIVLQPASSYVQAQPKGVVLVLGAWNYPFNVTIGPCASALAAGNCIVVKPSEVAAESAQVMQRIFQRLDQRAVRCVLGGPEVSSALVEQTFDHIVYTGGPRVAKLIATAAAKNLTPVTFELGGKSPVFICAGTNLQEACRRIVTHKFVNAGQTCIAPDYILVERSVRDAAVEQLLSASKAIFGGAPESAPHFARPVNVASAQRLRAMLQEDHKGKVIFGGSVVDSERYVPPTIVLDPSLTSKLMSEEIFGPFLPILTVDSYKEGIRFVNSRAKPLALYVFASSAATEAIIAETSSGAVVVGDAMLHKGNPNLPFGGIGNSGMGKLHGIYGFNELSNLRAVMYRPLFMPSPISLPVNKLLANLAFAYATGRPLRALRQLLYKPLTLVALVLLLLARKFR